MSSPNRTLTFTKRAQRDLRAIQIYTIRQWGEDQSIGYESALVEAASLLLDSPELGEARNDIGRGLRAKLAERHIIYYRVHTGCIEIVRILHERVDAIRVFSRR